ncbi:hypothetical protein A4A49_60872, partial [Nicotiana attenuata]
KKGVSLLAMIHIEKDGGVWILKQKKFVTSIDVAFDEVSSYYFAEKTCNHETIFDGDQEHLQLIPEGNSWASNNDLISTSNTSISDGAEQQTTRRSTREKQQPSYVKDYQVQLNYYSITSCFFIGRLDDEPASFEEAKRHPKWETAMQEGINALNKNQTWELVSKPKNCELITC